MPERALDREAYAELIGEHLRLSAPCRLALRLAQDVMRLSIAEYAGPLDHVDRAYATAHEFDLHP